MYVFAIRSIDKTDTADYATKHFINVYLVLGIGKHKTNAMPSASSAWHIKHIESTSNKMCKSDAVGMRLKRVASIFSRCFEVMGTSR